MKNLLAIILSFALFFGCLSAYASDTPEGAEKIEFNKETEYTFKCGGGDDSPLCRFTFRPESDGDYQFNFTNNYKGELWDFYTRFYKNETDAKNNEDYISEDGYRKSDSKTYYVYSLKKGVTYYVIAYVNCKETLKEIKVPVKVTLHTHDFKNYYTPATEDEFGEYGKVCKLCGFEKDIHTFNLPKNTKITSLKPKKKAFKITLKKVKGVKGYQVKISTSRKFTQKTTKVKTLTKTAAVIKGKKKKTYYVKVRTFKVVQGHKVYSQWSKTGKVKTK